METWFALPAVILKADFFRYLILFARGGIYADIDTEALKPAHLWLPDTSPSNTVGLIVGIEADPTREDWAVWYARRIQFCQWVMRSKVGHPVLREVIARITEITLKRKAEGRLTMDGIQSLSIIEWTGPAVWTDSIFWGMNRQTMTGKGTKGQLDQEEWSWVQFTGITEPKVFVLLSKLIVANWGYPCSSDYRIFTWYWPYGKPGTGRSTCHGIASLRYVPLLFILTFRGELEARGRENDRQGTSRVILTQGKIALHGGRRL